MTSYLMIAIGVLACGVGFWLTFGTTSRRRLADEKPAEAIRSARLLFVVFGIDLLLQVYQLDGARQPLVVAVADAATTSAIFCLLGSYGGALVGRPALPKLVIGLALGLFALAVGRAAMPVFANFAGAPTLASALSLAWLGLAVALAFALARSQQNQLQAALPPKTSRRANTAFWPTMVGSAMWTIVAILVLRAALAPFLGSLPLLLAALDSPLVDTLCVVTFVTLGAAVGGFGRVVEETSPKPMARGDEDRRERLLRKGDAVLDRDFTDPGLTMPRLAAAVGCSEHRFSAALNQGRGINFFAYLNERRVREAMKLIRNGGMSTTDIAYACGYNSRSTFYAAFKSVTGQSPKEWRMKNDDIGSEVSEQADQDTLDQPEA